MGDHLRKTRFRTLASCGTAGGIFLLRARGYCSCGPRSVLQPSFFGANAKSRVCKGNAFGRFLLYRWVLFPNREQIGTSQKSLMIWSTGPSSSGRARIGRASSLVILDDRPHAPAIRRRFFRELSFSGRKVQAKSNKSENATIVAALRQRADLGAIRRFFHFHRGYLSFGRPLRPSNCISRMLIRFRQGNAALAADFPTKGDRFAICSGEAKRVQVPEARFLLRRGRSQTAIKSSLTSRAPVVFELPTARSSRSFPAGGRKAPSQILRSWVARSWWVVG